MMEKKLDTFEELMLDFLAGKLSEDGERKLLHFLQSDISYQQRYKEMARTRLNRLSVSLNRKNKLTMRLCL